ncbi:MAG TPA: glycosyl transferase, partial [Elusimicrobia bacterium]|nr:glycosyl transferase [Elusimicrobiota bacterium]
MAKVLIIKLGYSETLDKEISVTSSLGDVLRTTIILNYFKNDVVTWLVDEKAYPLLEGNPYVKRILIF